MIKIIAPNVYCITVPLPNNPLRELNTYLIRGDDRDLLIDTGFRCDTCFHTLQGALNELGSDADRRDVLLTHLHSDHSGMADLFAGKDRKIFISNIDLAYEEKVLCNEVNYAHNKRFMAEGFPATPLLQASAQNPARTMALPRLTEQFCGLKNRDVISVGEYRLQTIYVPGHTPGNCMFWEESSGLLFSGDHVLFDITPNITAWAWIEDSLGDYLESLCKVRLLPVRCALPGHRSTGDYSARIDTLLKHHEMRLADVQEIIRSEPGLNAYDITGRMKWRIHAKNWDEFPVVQKVFAVGECLAHLDYLRKRGMVKRTQEKGIYRYDLSV